MTAHKTEKKNDLKTFKQRQEEMLKISYDENK